MCLEYGLLGETRRDRCLTGDVSGKSKGLLQVECHGYDAVNQAGGLSLRGRDHASGQDDLHGQSLAHGARKTLRSTGAGHHADVDLRLTELCRITGNDHVRMHRKLAAPSQSKATHSRNDGRLDLTDALPSGELIACKHRGERCVGHFRDICPGGKSLVAAVDHNTANRIIGIVGLEGLNELDHGLQAERIEHGRPIELDRSNARLWDVGANARKFSVHTLCVGEGRGQKYHMDNLYCSLLESDDVHVPMDEDIQRHVAALRLRDREHVRVLNGRGLVAICRAERAQQGIRLAVIESTVSAPQRPMITVALGVLDHRERFEMAVEKLTELAVARIIPMLCQRSRHLRTTNERLMAKAIAAITQSGNPFLPLIDPATELEQVVSAIAHDLVIVGDAHGQPPVEDARRLTEADQVLVVVGPEGGLSDEELQLFASNDATRRWRIGDLRLRAETAAIALASAVRSMNV